MIRGIPVFLKKLNGNKKIKPEEGIAREIFEYSRDFKIILVLDADDFPECIISVEILPSHSFCHHE